MCDRRTGGKAGIQAAHASRLGRQLAFLNCTKAPADMSITDRLSGLPLKFFMNEMHNPPHPGLTLRDDVLPALGLQVGEAAAQLGVDRTTLSKVLNGRGAISPAMALRIERWLGRDRGGAAEVWLAQQTAYDLWQARLALKKSKTLQAVKSAAKRAA